MSDFVGTDRLAEIVQYRTLLIAFVVPFHEGDEIDDIDPDIMADEFALMVNEDRQRNADDAGRPDYFLPVEVSAIPAPQWVTSETMQRLRNNDAEIVRLRGEVVALRVALEAAEGENDRLCESLDAIDRATYGWTFGRVSTVIDKVRLIARAALAGSER